MECNSGDEDLLKSLNLITGESVGDASALAAALVSTNL